MKHVAVLVSGGGTNLQALINARDAGNLGNAALSLVISSKSSAYALQRASDNGIPAVAMERSKFHNAAEYDEAMLETLKRYNIYLVVTAGFLTILGPKVLAGYGDRIINIHPSLIPSFCGKGFYGLHVHKAALDYGVKVTGATVHFVNGVIDGGKILLQKAVDVMPDDTPETLQRRVMEEAEWVLLPEAVKMLCGDSGESGDDTEDVE